MHGSLRKLGNAVFVVVAGQGLRHPEERISPIDHAKDHAQDQRHPRHFRLGQSKTPDSQCFYNAQHAADQIHGQIPLHPGLLALGRLHRERQRPADERLHLCGTVALLLHGPAPLQQFCHRHAQCPCQRQQYGHVRQAEARLP